MICKNCGHEVDFDLVGITKNNREIKELRHFEDSSYDNDCQVEMDDGDICGCPIAEIKEGG